MQIFGILGLLIITYAVWLKNEKRQDLLFIFGGLSVVDLVLALIFGIIFGTYSSIFIASPLLVEWNKWTNKNN